MSVVIRSLYLFVLRYINRLVSVLCNPFGFHVPCVDTSFMARLATIVPAVSRFQTNLTAQCGVPAVGLDSLNDLAHFKNG